jgi:hypothetical protein
VSAPAPAPAPAPVLVLVVLVLVLVPVLVLHVLVLVLVHVLVLAWRVPVLVLVSMTVYVCVFARIVLGIGFWRECELVEFVLVGIAVVDIALEGIEIGCIALVQVLLLAVGIF